MKEQLERDEITLKARSVVQNAEGKMEGLSSRTGVFGKILGSLDYFDYAYLAFTLGSRVYKLLKRVRSRKKK